MVLICAHSVEGAMGLILNRPLPEIRFDDLLDQLGIEADDGARIIEVRSGGPVEPGRGFVLDPSALRLTVVSADDAVESFGCRLSP